MAWRLVKVVAVSLGAVCLALVIVRIPQMALDRFTWLEVLAGLAPYLFIRGELIGRYSSVVLAMGGSFGFLALVRDYLACKMGRPDCIEHEPSAPTVALLWYGLALVIGLAWLRRFSKGAHRPDRDASESAGSP